MFLILTRLSGCAIYESPVDGGDWQQDMDRGADMNLLTEYGVRLGHPVSDRPEPMEIKRLKSFPARKSPPMVYMTGQQNIQLGVNVIYYAHAEYNMWLEDTKP